MTEVRSQLSRYASLMRDPDPTAALRIAAEAYRETGGEVAIIFRSRLPNWADRKQLELLAEKAGLAIPKRRGE